MGDWQGSTGEDGWIKAGENSGAKTPLGREENTRVCVERVCRAGSERVASGVLLRPFLKWKRGRDVMD